VGSTAQRKKSSAVLPVRILNSEYGSEFSDPQLKAMIRTWILDWDFK
jgi:hypothetical protein